MEGHEFNEFSEFVEFDEIKDQKAQPFPDGFQPILAVEMRIYPKQAFALFASPQPMSGSPTYQETVVTKSALQQKEPTATKNYVIVSIYEDVL